MTLAFSSRVLAVEAFLTDTCLVQSARVVGTLSRRAHIWIWHLGGHACIRMHMTRTWYTWYVSLFHSWSMCTWTFHLSQISCIWLCNSRATSLHVWPNNPRIWRRVRMHARLASSPHRQPGLFPSCTDSMLIKNFTSPLIYFLMRLRPNKRISIYQQIRCYVANPPNPVLAPCMLLTPATTYVLHLDLHILLLSDLYVAEASNHGFSCLFPSSGRAWKLSPQQPCVRVYMHL